MKKYGKKALALALCLVMCVGIFTGCGKKEEEPKRAEVSRSEQKRPERRETESSEIYAISAYYDNDDLEISLDFYDDFTVYLSDANVILDGTYYFEDEDFVMTIEDEIYEGYIADEGVLSIFDVDGYFYEVEEIGYYPDETSGGISMGENVGNRGYEDQEDGTIRYRDYDASIAATYADWMTNYEDMALPGSVLIGDDEGGYVLAFNVTDDYWDYDGYDEDFLLELYNGPISEAMNAIYGTDWEATALNLMQDKRDSVITVGESNFYNDDFDVMVRTVLYHTLRDDEVTDVTIAKVYIYEYGDDGQLRALKDDVKRCTGLS